MSRKVLKDIEAIAHKHGYGKVDAESLYLYMIIYLGSNFSEMSNDELEVDVLDALQARK